MHVVVCMGVRLCVHARARAGVENGGAVCSSRYCVRYSAPTMRRRAKRPCISRARGKVERAAGEIAAEYVNMCTRIVSPYLGECHRERDKREEGY